MTHPTMRKKAMPSQTTWACDESAVKQAIEDGIKLIPIKELPKNFDRRYLGWIDTPENRIAIQNHCDRLTRKEETI